MAAEPRLATAALGIHNAVIRKAQYSNAGVVLQQEGDSFTVAFHKPLDAVTFCLQVGSAVLLLDVPASGNLQMVELHDSCPEVPGRSHLLSTGAFAVRLRVAQA
jgi:hypothetical protein